MTDRPRIAYAIPTLKVGQAHLIIKQGLRDLTRQALEIAEICMASQAQRAAAYRTYGQWIETGRATGGLALANLLYSHVDRLASHLFSPTDLRFAIDFENVVTPDWYDKGSVVARKVSREWERKNIDVNFQQGVRESLAYAACILRQSPTVENGLPTISSRLVMPWSFGVYNEMVTDLSDQEAMCETIYYNKHEVWRRIRHLPEADKLYRRIMSSAQKETGAGLPTSFMHQVLSTAVLNVSLQNATQPQPGGIVQLTNDPNFATLGPTVAAELYPMHEISVWDDELEDYVTIQYFEPDILVAPRLKKCNLCCPHVLPYTLIQANPVANYFWGRSEITDLMELQQLLTTTLDDGRRVMGQQFDKLLAFPGFDGISREMYAAFRTEGWVGMPQGSSVTDLTPKFPQEWLPYVQNIIQLMERVSGFSNILSGSGEPGVRAGVHADTLMKTASPRLRDRALLLERQCAEAAETTLSIFEAKDARATWTDAMNRETDFQIGQLPDDRRISIDSHSGSPIYHDDHQNLIAFGVKAGFIGGDTAIEQLPFNHKEILIQRFRQMEAARAKMIQEHPELLQQHRGGGHHRAA